MSALALVLLSAAAHAAWNAVLKRADDPAASATLIVAGAAASSLALAIASGQVVVPHSAWLPTLGAGAVEAAYFYLLAGSLARLPLGTAYGVARGAGLLVTWPLSAAFMGEHLDLRGSAGAALVVAGLSSAIFGRGGGRGTGWSGVSWALGCAVAIGIYPLAYQAALRGGAPDDMLFACSLGLSLPVLAALLGRRRWSRLREAALARPGALAASSLLCAASFLLFLGALGQSGAAWAAAMRNTSVLFATVLGWVSGDPRTAAGAAGALLIAVGAALLAGG